MAAATVDVTFLGFVVGHGGDALQMLNLAAGIQEHGAGVRILVPEIESTIEFQRRCAALDVDCVRTPLITASMSGARQRLGSVVRLLRSVRSPVVHFHTGNAFLPTKVMTSLELLRYRRCFVTLHSPYETMTPGQLRARFWATTAARRFHAVISPSEHARMFQVRCGVPEEIAVVARNSIDPDELTGGDGQSARATIGVGPDDPIVLFSSRIDGQKRPVEAVEIFAGIAAEFPTAVLVFVGRGDEEQNVRDAAARLGITDRVRLTGYRTDVPDWLAASTVWLLPTERENFSLAVLEALAAGCAVLSTSCRGNDEVLVDGVNASVFPVGDVAAATTRLRGLLGDPALRRRLSCAAVESARPFTVANMVERYCEIYQRSDHVPAALMSATGHAS